MTAQDRDTRPVEEYVTESTSKNTAKIEPVELVRTRPPQKPCVRTLVRGTVIEDNPHDPAAALKIALVHQKRRNKTDQDGGSGWSDLSRLRLDSLQPGTYVEISLDSAQTLQLGRILDSWYSVARKGATSGTDRKVVVSGDEAGLVKAISSLADTGAFNPQKTADILGRLFPDLAASVAALEVHRRHHEAIRRFGEQLGRNDWKEREWEEFFRTNEWILGYGLAYQYLSEIAGQATVGGPDLTGKGEQRVDFLMATAAKARFTVLVDIKTPSTQLVLDEQYRSRTHCLGHELVGGVAQLQSYCRTWATSGSRQEDNAADLQEQGISTVEPKGVLIAGHTKQLDSVAKRTTLELFRRNLHNPEIVTFDELYKRAGYWVEQKSESVQAGGPIADTRPSGQ